MARADVLAGLVSRWDDTGVGATRQRLVAELLAGSTPTSSPFGRVEGRLDLRGLPVTAALSPQTSRADVGTADGQGWRSIDLSGAELSGMNWRGHRVEDCVFDHARLEGLRCWAVTVTGSSFVGADLRAGQLGPLPTGQVGPSRWSEVDLRRSDLRGAHAGAEFTSVDLGNAKLTGADLGWSTLTDVRFAGVVHGLTIGARPVSDRPAGWTLTAVDLTAARPRGLRLIGVDLGTRDVRLPEDDEHWRVPEWPAVLDAVESRALRTGDDDARLAAAVWVDRQRADLGPRQREGFVARRDLLELGGPALAALVRDVIAPAG
ncbi:MAG: pentapeptide repeat-containing protein [Kineosporiaceae bacterium]